MLFVGVRWRREDIRYFGPCIDRPNQLGAAFCSGSSLDQVKPPSNFGGSVAVQMRPNPTEPWPPPGREPDLKTRDRRFGDKYTKRKTLYVSLSLSLARQNVRASAPRPPSELRLRAFLSRLLLIGDCSAGASECAGSIISKARSGCSAISSGR